MNKHHKITASSNKALRQHSTEISHVQLSFEDNKLAGMLFGKFDEHLALFEQLLGIEVVSRGNNVDIHGEASAVGRAKYALDQLYDKLQTSASIDRGDVEGAIRMANQNNDAEVSGDNNSKNNSARISTHKKTVQARTPMQGEYMRAMAKGELVFGIGPAGTGKTYLAVAYAASLLEQGAIDRIILSRPAVEAGERLGFLPGDMKEKVDPYLRPLYDALYDMMPGDKVERAITNGIIEIAPLAFMRGRTLANAVVILDEAQNTTTMQMKMFLTRLGENSCMFVTGDPSQIDLPRGQKSGLVDALEILKSVKGIAQIKFTSADVVRHRMVAKIVEAYDRSSTNAQN